MQRLKVFILILVTFLLIAGVLFVSAGSIALPMFWAYLMMMAALTIIVLIAVYPRMPEIMQEKKRSGDGQQDKLTGPVLLALFLVHWSIAGIDVGRYHWSSSVPAVLQITGLMIAGCGFSLLAWSIIINRFYSSRVNVQIDRGQEVITSGPYRFVRHPGYIGWILFMLSGGIALGSWLSGLPMFLLAILIVRRTYIEDKMLQNDLKGYKEYTSLVRFRLIPGLW